MPVNRDKVDQWNIDVAASVDLHNEWFMRFAPQTYRDTRLRTTADVESALALTENLTNIAPATLRQHPAVLQMLRMATAPPLARDLARRESIAEGEALPRIIAAHPALYREYGDRQRREAERAQVRQRADAQGHLSRELDRVAG